jgi:acetyl-CoA carboxylase carboxyltransferase component
VAPSSQPFPVLPSSVDPGGETFRANVEGNQAQLARLEELLAESRAGGGARYVERHRSRGKLLPRERIELLLDRDSHFLELCPLAGAGVSGHAPGSSIVAGIGVVSAPSA